MMMSGFLSIRKEIEGMNVRFLGSIPFDPKVEAALGDSEKLLKTEFARSLSAALDLI